MDSLFSQWVATDAWRSEATTWVRDELARVGRRVTGEVEQRRIRPWSTQLVVPTDQGIVWFKANCPSAAYEPAVHQRLSQLEPGEVDPPLAIDAERGWMMTFDRGVTLGDSHDASLQDWQGVVELAATLQLRLVRHGDELVGAGLPDCSPGTVPARYAWLIEQLAALPADHPSHLAADGAQSLREQSDVVDRAVEELLAGPLGSSLQHGDLHPWNVFAVDGGLRIFDLGDAQWSHALETLAVPYGFTTRKAPDLWPHVLAAYAKAWSDVIDATALEALMTPAMVTHAVNRSFTWFGAVADAEPHDLAEWGDSPLYYLKLALKPFPPADPEAGP